jgi:uncharacterized membrane protein
VLLDLIRASLAATVAGVLPGWFWAKILCATTDRAERLTYSVALSITLVPVCALAQVTLFGGGVTLLVAVSSVLLVLFGGLAAYLRFGPAAGKGGPLFSPPKPPGALVLSLLAAASGVALWVASGMTPGVPRFEPPAVALPRRPLLRLPDRRARVGDLHGARPCSPWLRHLEICGIKASGLGFQPSGS